jgi:hypothetical protein
MPTRKQKLGEFGEQQVVKRCACPGCNERRTFRRLPRNFKCADVVCDFCGLVAQVKASDQSRLLLPRVVPGAAWKPQTARLDAEIRIPLYVVVRAPDGSSAIFYVAKHDQPKALFRPRSKPTSPDARRPNWLGFDYDLSIVADKAQQVA